MGSCQTGFSGAVAVQERDLNSDDDFGDANEVVYYHSNTLFSVCALSDANESVIERYRYDSYGACTVLDADGSSDADGISDVLNPYTFTGRRVDLETGNSGPATALLQYRNRYYHTGLGRFISRDPAGYPDSLNSYSYAVARVTISVDPRGTDYSFSASWEQHNVYYGWEVGPWEVDEQGSRYLEYRLDSWSEPPYNPDTGAWLPTIGWDYDITLILCKYKRPRYYLYATVEHTIEGSYEGDSESGILRVTRESKVEDIRWVPTDYLYTSKIVVPRPGYEAELTFRTWGTQSPEKKIENMKLEAKHLAVCWRSFPESGITEYYRQLHGYAVVGVTWWNHPPYVRFHSWSTYEHYPDYP